MPAFLTDWTFWTAIIALAALCISLKPYFHYWFEDPKIDLKLQELVTIHHSTGNPIVTAYLHIRNVGGRKIRINKISMGIKKDEEDLAVLQGRNYIDKNNQQQNIVFTSLNLKPEEEWVENVNFLNFYSVDQERKYQSAFKKMRDEISRIKEERLHQEEFTRTYDKEIIVGDEFVNPFMDIFKNNFIWLPGEYRISINIETEKNDCSLVKDFRFILYESQSEDMQSIKEIYKKGEGILTQTDKPEKIFSYVRIKEI